MGSATVGSGAPNGSGGGGRILHEDLHGVRTQPHEVEEAVAVDVLDVALAVRLDGVTEGHGEGVHRGGVEVGGA